MKGMIVVCVLVGLSSVARADTDADAQALVKTWLDAQNQHDFAAYSALYAPSFVGVLRTSLGAEKKMKRKAWLAQRKKMFKLKDMTVAADDVNVKGTTVHFLQRWKGGGYVDHGGKLLVLAPDKQGALRITKEELLSSTPGWEDDKDAVLDATGLVSPIKIRVQDEGMTPDPDGGCTNATFVLYITDKKGKTLQHEIGYDVITTDGGNSTTAIEPSEGTTGTLYELHSNCTDNEGEYQVKWSGDAIVVTDQEFDENGSGPLETVFTVQLPQGAKVVPRD